VRQVGYLLELYRDAARSPEYKNCLSCKGFLRIVWQLLTSETLQQGREK
jgi:hypothetical protein